MKSPVSENDDLLKDMLMDEKHGYIFIEYNQQITSLDNLIETVKMTRAQILDTRILQEKPSGEKSILIKLDIQDVREVILNLLKYQLIKIKGYNFITKRKVF
jgi:hypothetical protein